MCLKQNNVAFGVGFAVVFKMATLAATRPSSSEWKYMKRRCVIVYGPMEGRMYFREDFTTGLQEIFPGGVKDNVLSFGPLTRNNEWLL